MHLTSCFHVKLGLLIYTKGWFEGSLLTKLNIVEWFAGKLPNFRQRNNLVNWLSKSVKGEGEVVRGAFFEYCIIPF